MPFDFKMATFFISIDFFDGILPHIPIMGFHFFNWFHLNSSGFKFFEKNISLKSHCGRVLAMCTKTTSLYLSHSILLGIISENKVI